MKKKQTIKNIVLTLFVAVCAVLFVVPLWMVIINSLKTRQEAGLFGIGLPTEWAFDNYITVFKEANIGLAMGNGLIYSIIVGVCAILFASMASFAIVRIKSKWSEAAYYLFLSGIVLPGAIIPTFFLLTRMSLINTYTGIIVVLLAMTMPISVFLYTGAVKSIPREIDEAGTIDGCGKLRLFFSLVFPLLVPTTITVAIFNFMGVWNDVTTQLYFVNADKWTMPMMVYRFMGMYSSNWNLVFADLLLTSIPVILIYIVGQKYLVSGMISGSVKG